MSAGEDEVVAHVEQVMGTAVSFHVYPGRLSKLEALACIDRARRRLHELDDLFSLWKPESPMSLLRSGRLAPPDAPGEIAIVAALCETAKEWSKGWFDPWAMPGGFDPTGLVKGWAVGQALSLLAAGGVRAAMVNGGGDIALLGTPPGTPHGSLPGSKGWHIGIRHPWREDALACVLDVTDAVATSGRYERGRHLIDPRTGTSAASTASATVTGPQLALADALATALAVGGDEVLALIQELDGYDAYLVRPDGSEAATAGIVVI